MQQQVKQPAVKVWHWAGQQSHHLTLWAWLWLGIPLQGDSVRIVYHPKTDCPETTIQRVDEFHSLLAAYFTAAQGGFCQSQIAALNPHAVKLIRANTFHLYALALFQHSKVCAKLPNMNSAYLLALCCHIIGKSPEQQDMHLQELVAA